MLIESFEHAEADFEARLLIDARNEAEAVVLATEKSLRRPDFAQLVGDDLSSEEIAHIDAALADTRAAISGTDRERIHTATHELNHATRHLAELMMNRSVREALAGRNVNDV
jgi:molecular chaperone DnaK/molecular chaperone HscA